ncbi:NAD(P)H-binding protein [Microbacterium sp. NIBRBAC000506063]|uniref:SDR family oxidoreductase n=1 Tax=Microbacterium sp. NIBRBAC000506063 TaxID=2734618 RepID=UPI002948B8AF|nr:NAD(P)H-binding protein [Microbacterium sp. NIBRBAC000506063]
MRIAVAGATGTLGRLVVEAVRTAGHDAVPLSRGSGIDLMTGSGLADALSGASAVIDASSTNSTSAKESISFFGTVTRHLLAAERAAAVPHHVAISIIGAAEADTGYYAGKAVQEEILRAQGSGWSVLRAAQFHEFAAQLLCHGRIGPLQVAPAMRSQPIAAAEVAGELVEIAGGEPRGFAPTSRVRARSAWSTWSGAISRRPDSADRSSRCRSRAPGTEHAGRHAASRARRTPRPAGFHRLARHADRMSR